MKLYVMTCLLAIGCLSIPAKAHDDDQTIQPTTETTTTQDSLDNEAPKGIINKAKAYITQIKNDHPLYLSTVGTALLGISLACISKKLNTFVKGEKTPDLWPLCFAWCCKFALGLFPLGCALFDTIQIAHGVQSQIPASMIALKALFFYALFDVFYFKKRK